MLSPGSRVGFYGTVGQGATRMSANSQTSPGLFGSGNTVVVRRQHRRGVRQRRATAADRSLLVRRRLRILLDPQLLEHDLRRLHPLRVQQHRGERPVLLRSPTVFPGGQAQAFTTAGACDPSYSLWQIGTHHDWFPLPGLRFAVDVLYTRVELDMAGQTVTLARDRPRSPTSRRSSDWSVHRQGPWPHLGHGPRSALLGRRLSRANPKLTDVLPPAELPPGVFSCRVNVLGLLTSLTNRWTHYRIFEGRNPASPCVKGDPSCHMAVSWP